MHEQRGGEKKREPKEENETDKNQIAEKAPPCWRHFAIS